MEYTSKYESTNTYEPKDSDIVLTNDGYLCIYEAENIGNIIFIATDEKHKNSLFDNVRFFTKTLIRYGVKVVTVHGDRWRNLLNRISILELKYNKGGYYIYVRKDL